MKPITHIRRLTRDVTIPKDPWGGPAGIREGWWVMGGVTTVERMVSDGAR